MTEPYIGQIQTFGFNFNPRGWAFCNGALLPIQQNTALFSLLGTQYGGNGQTTFQLPNFSARAACQQGMGPGLSPRSIGATFGAGAVTLNAQQLPAHGHQVTAFSQTAPGSGRSSPVAGGGLSFLSNTTMRTYGTGTLDTTLAPAVLQPGAGGAQPHENRQPYLAVNFCIALEGIFPSFQ